MLAGWASFMRIVRPAQRPPTGAIVAPPPHWPDMRIDLNRAGAAELTALPGIGPNLADAIVADRQARGPFRSLNDLDRVPRIGPALIDEIAPFVVIGEPPPPSLQLD
jgi:competence protein ComEA